MRVDLSSSLIQSLMEAKGLNVGEVLEVPCVEVFCVFGLAFFWSFFLWIMLNVHYSGGGGK